MKVLVVTEFYPRRADPVLGIWAHRQAVAAREAGANVEVLVLHRPIPYRADLAGGPAAVARSLRARVGQPLREGRDGVPVTYLPFLSPGRPRTYGSWGAWAAPVLRIALPRIRRRFDFELVHAHNAIPAGDAVRRVGPGVPLVVSVHGADVYLSARAARHVPETLGAARLVLANSAAIGSAVRERGAREVRVVRLGTDVPAAAAALDGPPRLVTVANLDPRKRHADVLRAMASLGERVPGLRYDVIGDGPERATLEALAGSLGLGERVAFHGQLEPSRALALAREASVFVMPSTDEAFGVAYVEAMAAGLPAIGCAGEPGPEELAAAGGGIVRVPPRDVEALAREIEALAGDPERRRELGAQARATVLEHFTWERCGRETVAAYEAALAGVDQVD